MEDKSLEELLDMTMSCATEVYEIMGAGYIESVYEEAMAVEFRKRDISYEVEWNTEVFYKNEKVGVHRIDFVVEEVLVVELKAVSKLSKSNIAQLISYLKTLEKPKGLLINFPYPQAEVPEFKAVSNDTKG